MPMMRVVPEGIQDHAKDVALSNQTIQQNMTDVKNAIDALRPSMIGANANAADQHYAGLNTAVTKLLEVSTQYANAVVAHSNTVSETDASLAQQVGAQSI